MMDKPTDEHRSGIDMQNLVNAQVEVNRACHLMNARMNRHIFPYSNYTDEDLADKKVCDHIEQAINHLQRAMERATGVEGFYSVRRNHHRGVRDENKAGA